MNNKILIGVVALIVVIGAVVLIAGKGGYQTPTPIQSGPTTESTQPPTTAPSPIIEATDSAQQPTVILAQPGVALTQSGFEPKSITVKAGTRVTWVNNSGSMATVDSAGHPTHLGYPPLNLGQFSNGQSLSLVFDAAGTYKYHNHLNPSQTGTVVVE